MALITCGRCGSLFGDHLPACPICRVWGAASAPDTTLVHSAETAVDGRGEQDLGRELTLAFRGSPGDYFRIWAVNLCLSLLTVGIFSAWAKVRRKRYMYSSTTLDGTSFQYLGQPGPILRGRIAAAVLFGLYYTSTHFLPPLLPYVLAAAALLAPWMLVRSAAFNARYSAFRHMTFRFDGSYGDVVRQLHGWGLVPALAVGTAFNWFGDYWLAAAVYVACAFAYPFWQRRLKALIVDHTSFGGHKGALSARGRDFLRAYLAAGMAMAGAFFVLVLIIAALSGLRKVVATEVPAAVFAVGAGVAYVIVISFVQARISNLVWNGTRLGALRFTSSLSGGGLAALYLGNMLAVLASLGLLIPWAAVRSINYRLSHLGVFLDGELSEFHADEAPGVPALGAELGGFFDVDLSL